LPRASAVKMPTADDQGGVEAARHPSFVVRWYSLEKEHADASTREAFPPLEKAEFRVYVFGRDFPSSVLILIFIVFYLIHS
jgi:hypothetical protein